jgi:DNA-binding GntR family transcriptional regulator
MRIAHAKKRGRTKVRAVLPCGLVPSPPPTLIDQAYEAILAAICDGRLAPSQRINQDDLATSLGISRQPVGQALSLLKWQGFVRDTGRRGLIVAPIDPDFFRAIYEVREALDSLAANLAAQRCTRADAAEGRKLLAEGRAALRSGRIEVLIDADMRFHIWICGVAGNPLLSEAMRLYWNHLRRAMGEVLRDPAAQKRVWDEHEEVLRGIASRDPAVASRRATEHARQAAQTMAKAMSAPSAKALRGIIPLRPVREAKSRGR